MNSRFEKRRHLRVSQIFTLFCFIRKIILCIFGYILYQYSLPITNYQVKYYFYNVIIIFKSDIIIIILRHTGIFYSDVDTAQQL